MSGNVIDRGIERIKRHGWAQGMDEATRTPKRCMLTSLAEGGDGKSSLAAYAAICAELGIDPDCGSPKVWAFNDDPSTSLEDVLLVMKRASARLDEASA